MVSVFTPPGRHKVPPVSTETNPDDYAPAIYFSDPTLAGDNLWVVGGVVTSHQPVTPDLIQYEYLGGHISTLTAAEVALLTAAGFGASISVVTDPTAPSTPSGGNSGGGGSSSGSGTAYGAGNYSDGPYG